MTCLARWPLLVPLDLALALVLIVSSPERMSAPSFAAQRQVAPFWAHGLVLLAIAVWLAARPRTRAGYVAGAGWFAFWLLCFALSAALSPAAALTALPPYAAITAAHLLLATRRED